MTSFRTLRQRARYRWDNSDAAAMHAAQRAIAGGQARRAFSRAAAVRTDIGVLTIGYVGIETGLRTILPLAEQLVPGDVHDVVRTPIRRGPVRALCAELAPTADILIVGGQRRAITGSGLGGPHVDAPFRVHLVRSIPGTEDELLAQVSRRDRQAFRKDLRTRGFDTEITRDESALADFYHHMHRPTMRRRHGAQMLSESLEVARDELLAHGFLFLVRSHGVPVAGALCTYDRRAGLVTTRLLGVADGAEEHYGSGAFKGLYHLLAEWCRRQGVGRMDLFATQAWTAKGIFQWKRRLHPHVVLPPNRYRSQRIRLHLLRDNDLVRDFMVANPLITADPDADDLAATWFHDRDRPVRTDVKVGLPGITTERHVDLDEVLARAGKPKERTTHA